MTSWEELFVDREIDDAWRSFRLEVTEAIEALDFSATLEFRSDYVDENVAAGVTRDVDALRVTLWRTKQQSELRTFGFRSDRRGSLVLILGPEEIDRATAGVLLGLRGGAIPVVHPSFLDLSYDAEPPRRYRRVGRLPVAEQRRGTRHEVVTPLDPEDLAASVRDALAERVNGPFETDDDGGFTLTSEGAVCFVNVREGFDIEVWTVLAFNVEHPASVEGFQKMLPKLTEETPRYRYALQDGVVIAARFVDGYPFVPTHLYAAAEATLELSREHRPMGDYLSDLAHPEEGCQPTSAEDGSAA